MRFAGLVRALGVAYVIAVVIAPADAQTAASELPLPDNLSGGARPEQVLLFGGFDLWHFSLGGYGGLQWAANGLNDDGFIVRLIMAQGVERYRTPSGTITTDIFRASVLPGWRFKRGEFEFKLFAGADLEDHNLTPDFVTAKLRGPHGGARVAAEAWLEPLPQMMLATSGYLTSVGMAYGMRVAAGWRLLDAFWIGPELSGSRDEFSSQTRLGAHLTGLKTDAIEWSLGAGYLTDSYQRGGAYARIGFVSRQ